MSLPLELMDLLMRAATPSSSSSAGNTLLAPVTRPNDDPGSHPMPKKERRCVMHDARALCPSVEAPLALRTPLLVSEEGVDSSERREV